MALIIFCIRVDCFIVKFTQFMTNIAYGVFKIDEITFLTRQTVNTGRWEIDSHGFYSLVMIAFAPICTCKNSRRICRHNAITPRSRDVTDQQWWRHIVMPEKTVLSDTGEISDR